MIFKKSEGKYLIQYQKNDVGTYLTERSLEAPVRQLE